MLKQEVLKKITGLLGLDLAKLEAAIKSDKEEDFVIPDGLNVLTTEQLDSRDTQMKTTGETEGVKKGKELGRKEIKKAFELPEDAPVSDPAKLADAIRAKVTGDATKPVDEKIKELGTQLEGLKTNLATKDGEVQAWQEKYERLEGKTALFAAIPPNAAKILSHAQYATLITSEGYGIADKDGIKTLVIGDNVAYRDNATQKPLPLGDAMKELFSSKTGWLEAEAGGSGGRGGSDNPSGGKFTKASEVRAAYEKAGKDYMAADIQQQYMADIKALVAENKEFVLD